MTTAPERPPVDSPARAAARWWADHLTRVAAQDNGDDSAVGGMVAAMMLLASSRAVHTPDDAARFEDALTDDVQACLITSPEVWISTEYGPDTLLCGAATQARVILEAFSVPIKTDMVITRDAVRVRHVYRSGSERQLWPLET
ncbi:hypothetical protein [Deinococcus rufus]|uniref:Uncharacterized protein n=1 Tax=Deinococcus rufus TaxID=2136097 RepID=A0ABV7Z7S4_9DEIO